MGHRTKTIGLQSLGPAGHSRRFGSTRTARSSWRARWGRATTRALVHRDPELRRALRAYQRRGFRPMKILLPLRPVSCPPRFVPFHPAPYALRRLQNDLRDQLRRAQLAQRRLVVVSHLSERDTAPPGIEQGVGGQRHTVARLTDRAGV